VKGLSKMKVGTQIINWDIEFNNYLSSLKGKSGVPLIYVIRLELPEDHTYVSEEEGLLYEVPLTGAVFIADLHHVYRILILCVLGTDGWEWIKDVDGSKDGRLAK